MQACACLVASASMCVLQIKHLMIMKWTIKLKRVYEPAEADDGLRILVDRVWPRGIKKSDLRFDIWAKDVTPSSEARQFFHADPSGNWDWPTRFVAAVSLQ